MYEWWWYSFVEPWAYGDWMGRAVLTSALVALACGVLGCWLYVRRLSMMGDALSHVVVPGLALAFIITGHREPTSMLLGAMVAGVGASALIALLQRRVRVKEDAAIGVVFTALFALGVILISSVARRVHLDADCVLFGNVLGVRDGSIWLMAGVGALVLLITLAFFRPLLISSFDPTYALALGLPVAFIHHALMALLSVTAVAGFEAVGAILVVALLIAPAATAHLLTSRMTTMLLIAAVHGLISAVLGVYAAVWFGVNPAGAIVLVGALLYTAALLFSPHRGVLARALRAPHNTPCPRQTINGGSRGTFPLAGSGAEPRQHSPSANRRLHP